MNSIKINPAGTIMCGRGMLNQLGYEMSLMGVTNPCVVYEDKYYKKAKKASSFIHFEDEQLPLSKAALNDSDCLILAGSKKMKANFSDEKRFTIWILLSEEELDDFNNTGTNIIVIDSMFIKKSARLKNFIENFALSVSDGLVKVPKKLSIPDSFIFACRTSVIAGDDTLKQLPDVIKALSKDLRRPMVLSKGIVARTLVGPVVDSLEGLNCTVFDKIPPDSNSTVVNEISRLFKQNGCDLIVAIGGGSVLDTAKGVLLALANEDDDLLSMAGSNVLEAFSTPFIAVPTTSGTGSEVTNVAVITDDERQRKCLYLSNNLQADYAILDSKLTASLPSHITAMTAMDALSHSIEAFTCLGKNPVSDMFALKAIELIRDNLISSVNEPENLQLRYNLAIASMFAGQAFSNSMVGMVHTIGHSVGAVCHAAHGCCMAVLLPPALEYNYRKISKELEQLLPYIAGEDVAAKTLPEKRAHETIEYIRTMNKKLQELTNGRHPTNLSEIKDREGESLVKKSDFITIAETSIGDASIVYNPVELDVCDILEILEQNY
ncbi:MAG: iron-containing alcohol dehydrogenase [Spirochaetales bacterium]|nr:iron-containing alcohol dehydrogenase [Spirochaetales bacterium]